MQTIQHNQTTPTNYDFDPDAYFNEVMQNIQTTLSHDVSDQYFDRIEKYHLDDIINKMEEVLKILHDNEVSDSYEVINEITYLDLQVITHILHKDRNNL